VFFAGGIGITPFRGIIKDATVDRLGPAATR
jgi:ferredoxin-NADP reductase